MKLNVIIILIIIFIIGCSSDKPNNEQKNDTGKSEIANEKPVGPTKLLAYGFEQGNSYRYNLITELENSQYIESDTVLSSEMKQTANYTFTLNVDEVTANGISEISVFVETIKAEALVNGEKVNYDSKYLYSTRERIMFADYEALKNNSYSVRVNKHGEILDIYGTDKIVDEILKIQAGDKKLSTEERAAFTQQFINSGLVPLTEQLFRNTSKEKVRINSTWEQRYPSYIANFKIENVATFKVAEFQETEFDSLVKLDASLSVLWDGQNQVAEEGVKYEFSDPSISGSGVIYFNLSKGVVQKSDTEVRMEMEVTMESLDANQNVVKAFKRDFVVNKSKLELI